MTANAEVTIEEAAERLGVHYMTAYRYVRTGLLAARKEGATWHVSSVAVDELADQRTGGPRRGRRPGRTDRGVHRERLVPCLINGDDVGSWQIIESAMAAGATPEQVYLDILGPGMGEIGVGWERGTVSVAEEHRATTVAYRLLGLLGARHRRPGRRRGSLVLGSAPGDHHALPTAILSDLWRGRGFDVLDLGGHTPLEAFVESARGADRLVAVGVSASAPGNEASVRAVLSGLRDADLGVPLLLGGGAIRDAEHARSLGADDHAATGAEAIELVERIAAG